MWRNSLPLLALALSACDAATVGNRTQRSGQVKVTGVEEVADNSTAAPEAIGAPPAWRVVPGAAMYGDADQPPQFALRCDRDRQQIVFERTGGGASLSLSAGGVGASLDTRELSGGRVQARTGMNDAVLDAMARSQSQIGVGGGPETLSVPGGIAIRRVLDFCRKPPEPEPMLDAIEPQPESLPEPASIEPPFVTR